MNPLEDFANGLRQLGHRVQHTDTQALVDGRYLVTWRYPQFRVFRWDADAAVYGGPLRGDWEFITATQVMREAYRAVCR